MDNTDQLRRIGHVTHRIHTLLGEQQWLREENPGVVMGAMALHLLVTARVFSIPLAGVHELLDIIDGAFASTIVPIPVEAMEKLARAIQSGDHGKIGKAVSEILRAATKKPKQERPDLEAAAKRADEIADEIIRKVAAASDDENPIKES